MSSVQPVNYTFQRGYRLVNSMADQLFELDGTYIWIVNFEYNGVNYEIKDDTGIITDNLPAAWPAHEIIDLVKRGQLDFGGLNFGEFIVKLFGPPD